MRGNAEGRSFGTEMSVTDVVAAVQTGILTAVTLERAVGGTGVVVWCSIGADVVEFELGSDEVEYHGAVESGVLVSGKGSISLNGQAFYASQAVTLLGEEAVVKLDFPAVDWVCGGKEVDAVEGVADAGN
jgi:hypothetical protein